MRWWLLKKGKNLRLESQLRAPGAKSRLQAKPASLIESSALSAKKLRPLNGEHKAPVWTLQGAAAVSLSPFPLFPLSLSLTLRSPSVPVNFRRRPLECAASSPDSEQPFGSKAPPDSTTPGPSPLIISFISGLLLLLFALCFWLACRCGAPTALASSREFG